jgi:hypothetical protein
MRKLLGFMEMELSYFGNKALTLSGRGLSLFLKG